ncbi:thiamine-phosphate kinase [Pelagicoccus sp. SDUM812003]|uniref:thiamine-phosphate kinase n=1 Tax=Pelagicoccus sp. SDUM812003 TaxID=3041267 RepID=UPI00280DF877|nr:thiamine-phosphate kinase [Pelagicoccus sp. SDUM812003]MDQ8203697.1 thiamine-phosphate kinase [Pelagicoccus sp. SDUM812003]
MSPFTSDTHQSIATLGEVELIKRIRDWLGDANPAPPEGIGDDCARFQPSRNDVRQLVTTDPVIYGYHFDDQLSPEQTAGKLAKRNLSDVAAMGGTPRIATVSLALPQNVSIAWIQRFYETLSKLGRRYRFQIVGGDISGSDGFLGAFLTLIGETEPGHPGLLRHRAQPGSPLYVSGAIGGTRLCKHYDFEPRLEEGRWLARSGACLSCTDLSDGLGKDLKNILSPTTGCSIDCALLPISDDAIRTSKDSGHTKFHHAFNDGEDYELLFALDPKADLREFEAAWSGNFDTPLTRIGTFDALGSGSEESPLKLINAPDSLHVSGYEHLR